MSHTSAGRIVDGIDDGCSRSDHGDFAKTLDAGNVELEVRLIDEIDIDRAYVGVDRHDIFGKVIVENSAEAGVGFTGLAECCANSPTTPPLTWLSPYAVHDPTAVGNADDAFHTHTRPVDVST